MIEEAYDLVEPAWNAYTSKLPVGKIWTHEDLAHLDLQVLQQLGIRNDVEDVARYVQQNWMRMDRGLPQTLVRRAYSDARPCLQALKGLWMRMGIVSNIPSTKVLDEEVQLIGLEEFFPVRVASGSAGSQKPSPKIFHFAASRLQLEPKQIMFVGDDLENDYFGSRAVGMTPVLVDRKGKHLGKIGLNRVSFLTEIPSLLC